MNKPLDITGKKYNRLTAIKYMGVDSLHYNVWMFKCDCGNEVVKPSCRVIKGKVKSCGCAEIERRKNFIAKYAGIKTHGQSYSRLYGVWREMKQRCGRKNHYKNISVCDEWKNFEPFYEWAMNNGYRGGLSIDRIDNNGNYEPSNCRWTTRLEQQNNTSWNWKMTYKNITKTASEWGRELNRNPCCFYYWKRKGVADEEIIEHFIKTRGEQK